VAALGGGGATAIYYLNLWGAAQRVLINVHIALLAPTRAVWALTLRVQALPWVHLMSLLWHLPLGVPMQRLPPFPHPDFFTHGPSLGRRLPGLGPPRAHSPSRILPCKY